MKPSAPACARNRDPILAVLESELRTGEQVLEIGSGTGEHAVYFAANIDGIVWQTSDREESHSGIDEWRAWAGLDNVLAPLLIDTNDPPLLADRSYDAVFSSNTSHIMGMRGVCGMFSLAGRVLIPGGVFVLYGPFRQNGEFTGPSDQAFDESLRSQCSSMGIRDLEDLDALATDAGMARKALYAMPANNWTVVWTKRSFDVDS